MTPVRGMIRSGPPQATSTPATIILNRLDATTTNPNHVCVFATLVSEADTIHTPAINNNKKATSATLTPTPCEEARGLTSRR